MSEIRTVICDLVECNKRSPEGGCSVYPPEGQRFRDKVGYCPVCDKGPNKVEVKTSIPKKRAGQQKQKK